MEWDNKYPKSISKTTRFIKALLTKRKKNKNKNNISPTFFFQTSRFKKAKKKKKQKKKKTTTFFQMNNSTIISNIANENTELLNNKFNETIKVFEEIRGAFELNEDAMGIKRINQMGDEIKLICSKQQQELKQIIKRKGFTHIKFILFFPSFNTKLKKKKKKKF